MIASFQVCKLFKMTKTLVLIDKKKSDDIKLIDMFKFFPRTKWAKSVVRTAYQP
uniref:Uncharacterized protein n=1 Tax=Anguilla anguilla TaxID=7936 RepID=A0A0E9TNS7_ANGAN